MDRIEKLELLKRSLGLRHKIKVHESIKTPDTHDELALLFLTKWELEDELSAIEQLLLDSRHENVLKKKKEVEIEYFSGRTSGAAKKKKKD